MKLSIVATLYDSHAYIPELIERLWSQASELVGKGNFEIVLVNDGSPDNSLELALEEVNIRENILVVDLSRNFGHHKAIMTGLSYASGELVFLIDSDLEEQPEWLTLFSEQMKINNCDVVFGVQESRKGSKFEKISGRYFYSLINYLADAELPRSPTIARLMTKQYVGELILHKERVVYWRADVPYWV